MGYTHLPWQISDEKRKQYALSSRSSQIARKMADRKAASTDPVELKPGYDPLLDMPQLSSVQVKTLSLFSGGGGLDLGFDLAGFEHFASYEILPFAGETLSKNRPDWRIFSGELGDVREQNWRELKGVVDLIHGGPPCQPFSIAGRRKGKDDARDMFPEFVRAVLEIEPVVFIAENVPGFLSSKFEEYRNSLLARLKGKYRISTSVLFADDFGVPQRRGRAVMIGVRSDLGRSVDSKAFEKSNVRRGVREALGLDLSSADGPAPTLRSTLTGPRQTTSVANSTAAVKRWKEYGIWPHGVSPNPTIARSYPTKDGTHRMCVEECQLLQGFPLEWEFVGAVYQRLGMIGNSVCPPVAYSIAKAIRNQIFNS